nr:hypothetical protein [Tanacetum cinerariifolium]
NKDGNTACVTTASTAFPTEHPEVRKEGRKESYRQGTKAEEKTLKALMAIDGVGWDWGYMANERENHALVVDEETPTEFVLMANTKSKVFDNSLCSNECPEFVLNKKACYNCGDFSHLANDYRRRVQRETTRPQNHTYKRPPLRSSGHKPHGGSMRPSYRSAGHIPHGS